MYKRKINNLLKRKKDKQIIYWKKSQFPTLSFTTKANFNFYNLIKKDIIDNLT